MTSFREAIAATICNAVHDDFTGEISEYYPETDAVLAMSQLQALRRYLRSEAQNVSWRDLEQKAINERLHLSRLGIPHDVIEWCLS